MNVVSFYRFTEVADPERMQSELLSHCDERGLLGTVLLAGEGVNGTLAGEKRHLDDALDWLQVELSVPIDGRWTEAQAAPFQRLRVKIKNEIVALGRPDLRPDEHSGKHVGADEWNALMENPETLLIDARNQYEVEVGSFPNAVNPGTDAFRQFQEFAASLPAADRERPVAMFCTGGIRCEKAAALMSELGFSDVTQLQGGILSYLESVQDDDNRWQGECFVFDKRVAVDRDRAEGGYVQCHACRRPLSSEDIASPDYREGVSCPRCIGSLDAERAARLEERRKQVKLAEERGDDHIGAILD